MSGRSPLSLQPHPEGPVVPAAVGLCRPVFHHRLGFEGQTGFSRHLARGGPPDGGVGVLGPAVDRVRRG